MRKQFIVSAALMAACLPRLSAQWVQSGSTNANNVYTNGNVGIGFANASTAPSEKVQLNAGVLRITGTNAASYTPSGISAGAVLLGNNGTTNSWIQSYGNSSSSFTPLLLNPRGGNVRIGNATVGTALAVGGTGLFSGPVTVGASTSPQTGVAAQITGQSVFHSAVAINPLPPVPPNPDDEDVTPPLLAIYNGDLKIVETTDYSKMPDGNSADLYLMDGLGKTFNIFQGSGKSYMTVPDALFFGAYWDKSGSVAVYPGGKMAIGGMDYSEPLRRPTGYRLYVKEGILTEKVKVALSSDAVQWPDYVFEEGYKLRSIQEVAQFIKAHKHLPDVPSACEVKSNGIDVSQSDAILLRKLEELTLYAIQMKKRNQQLAAEFATLKAGK